MHHPGISPRHCQGIYFSLFHDIHNVDYGGEPQDSRDPFCEFQLIQDKQGYLVLIIALDSIYLNPGNNIA